MQTQLNIDSHELYNVEQWRAFGRLLARNPRLQKIWITPELGTGKKGETPTMLVQLTYSDFDGHTILYGIEPDGHTHS